MSEKPRAKTSETPAASPYRSLLVAAVVIVLGLLVTAGFKSYRDLAATRQHEEQIRARIAETQQRIDEIEQRIERIDEDPLTLERLAREELGMVRPGDVVIVLPATDDPRPNLSP